MCFARQLLLLQGQDCGSRADNTGRTPLFLLQVDNKSSEIDSKKTNNRNQVPGSQSAGILHAAYTFIPFPHPLSLSLVISTTHTYHTVPADTPTLTWIPKSKSHLPQTSNVSEGCLLTRLPKLYLYSYPHPQARSLTQSQSDIETRGRKETEKGRKRVYKSHIIHLLQPTRIKTSQQ